MDDAEITTVQELLKREYSVTEYNRIVKQLRFQSGSDMELLASMAHDKMLCLHDKLFAIAAMGRYKRTNAID